MTTAAPVVTDELIELNGLRFHYRDWPSAKPRAQALVLLHGLSMHARTWDRFAAAMSSHYRVLALDLRGHGESQWAPADQYRPQHHADDVEALVSALGLNDFVLLGHSMGGRAAYTYAARRPAALDRLVVVDITPGIPANARERIFSVVQSVDMFDAPEDAVARALAANPNADPAYTRERVLHNLMRTGSGQWTYRYDRAIRANPMVIGHTDPDAAWTAVRAVSVPTLFVRGEISDVVSPELRDRMVEAIADCRLVEVAGSGHNVPGERPQGFLDAVRTFI